MFPISIMTTETIAETAVFVLGGYQTSFLVTGHLRKTNSLGKCPKWSRKGGALPCID